MIHHYRYTDFLQSDSFRFNIGTNTLSESSFHMHTHEYSELVVILGGTAVHLTEFGSHPITKGDVFVIKEGVEHGFDDCAGLMLCNMMYDPQVFLKPQGDLYHLPGYYALFVIEPLYRQTHYFHSKLRLNIQNQQVVTNLIHKLEDEFQHQPIGYQNMIEALFMQLVVYLSRQYSEQPETVRDSVLPLANALLLIENSYQEPLKLETLAVAANLSTTHFLRVFKETFNTSPINYVIHVRISHACNLLRNSKRSISEVAFEVGFNDSNYFSRKFKQVMGQSPYAYRRGLSK